MLKGVLSTRLDCGERESLLAVLYLRVDPLPRPHLIKLIVRILNATLPTHASQCDNSVKFEGSTITTLNNYYD